MYSLAGGSFSIDDYSPLVGRVCLPRRKAIKNVFIFSKAEEKDVLRHAPFVQCSSSSRRIPLTIFMIKDSKTYFVMVYLRHLKNITVVL